MHADTTGVPIIVPKVHEATALGSAVGAAVGAGMYGSLAEAAPMMFNEEEAIEPDMAAHARYQPYFKSYLATYAALKPLMHEMAKQRAAKSEEPVRVAVASPRAAIPVE